ncbi:alpha/beta-hydrolase [Eremomyces bilateralis CBS 781.70]|uniref:Alpha/beta-hydrolase n=1 Tax=Eremomyces bilateralis CBS 781.70 TaxID=1392243 RepID=A0A6G1G1L1_9PEZI|nr:alpha/beta-hydrolase [Eremomyces bilateralis CBS 781.70]KAF1811816.1 alpha/beta-hydrolase [Eremomyces bilateralis CBS 781.70]
MRSRVWSNARVVHREYFYSGGEYVKVTSGNITDQYMVGQIYVERLTPEQIVHNDPIVFIAGAGQTGTNFLETPDGRPGWASYFLERGFVVYLTDQPERGRSPWLPGNGIMASVGTRVIESCFTAPSDFGLWPQAHLHNQWPGTGRIGDPVFDAFYATQVQLQRNNTLSEERNAKAYTALMDRVGPAHLIVHSQAGSYGWRVADARPQLVKTLIALEPTGPPFENAFPFEGRERTWGLTILEISYDPPAGPNAEELKTVRIPPREANKSECILQAEPPKKLKNLSKVPVLVVTGEASYHQPYEWCTVEYLKQGGVDVTFLDLPQEGIYGNGHMMFMEKNNMEISERALHWLLEYEVKLHISEENAL